MWGGVASLTCTNWNSGQVPFLLWASVLSSVRWAIIAAFPSQGLDDLTYVNTVEQFLAYSKCYRSVTWVVLKIIGSICFCFFRFHSFVHKRERTRRGKDRQRKKQVPCRAGSPRQDSRPGLWDNNLSHDPRTLGSGPAKGRYLTD